MANGVQLATAYVSLNVNTNDLGKQIRATFQRMEGQGTATGRVVGNNLANSLRGSFGSRLSGVSLFAPLQTSGVRWAARAGTTIATTLKNTIAGAMKTAGVGLGVGAGLGAADIIGSGLNRLKVLQAAQVQLRVMKKSAEEIRQITDDVLSVVQGTPISLDDAMQAVPQALGAGVRQGQELTQYIKDLGDAAASTGGKAGFGQISMIFSQILGKGRLMSEEVLQLEENGVRIRNALMNTLGITGEELNKRLQDGKIGMREVQQAVQATFGGLSKEMGNTFEGAMGNLRAASARLGANILGAIFGTADNPDDPLAGATDSVTKLTEKLNQAGQWVNDNREDIRGFFRGMGDAANAVGTGISKVVDWFGKLRDWGNTAATKIKSAFQTVGTELDKVKTKVESLVNTVKTKFDDIFGDNGWFARQFTRLGDMLDKVRDFFGLGMATAQASPGTTPFNPGPRAPGAPPETRTPPAANPGTTTIKPGTATIVVPGGTRLGGGSFGGSDPSAVKPGTPLNITGGKVTMSVDQGIMAQDTYVNCGPASTQILLSGNGVIETESVLAAEMGTGGGGTPFGGGNIAASLNKRIEGANFTETWAGSKSSDQIFSAIEASVRAGLGAVLNFNTSGGIVPQGVMGTKPVGYDGSPIAHYVAATGVDPATKSIQITDSMAGGQQYWISADNAADLIRNRGFVAGFAGGGHVWGAGTETSDSIPAMLSNGEHVLTAKDVQAMGGQSGVYAFRKSLHGFNNGGPVDPNIMVDTDNQLRDLQIRAQIAREQQRELPADASAMDQLQSQIGVDRARRELSQFEADLPLLRSGQTPPDRSLENTILQSTEDLRLANQALADARQQSGVPYSQMIQLNAAVVDATRQRDQAIAELNGRNQPANFMDEFQRSGGFVPVAAGNTGVAGTSALAGVFNMGNEFVGGLIDTGASLAQMAASAAVAGGTMGAGAAAGPAAGAAASYGIQLAASIGKRVASYGFQLASIGADSLIAQLFPFGAPRFIGYDYTSMMPQTGFQQAALTTIEKLGADAIRQRSGQNNFQIPPQPGSPESTLAKPELNPMTGQASIPAPGASATMPLGGMNQPGNINTGGMFTDQPWLFPGVGGGGGSWAKGGEVKIYDQGGILKPGELALNASRRPEKVLTEKQWASMARLQQPTESGPMVKIDAIYGMSPEDVASQIESKQRLAMMRYAGRP